MNSSIYSKLAVTNIKNNRKTYIPYILTAILTVMMFYIMDALYRNESTGDGSLKLCMLYGVWVIVIFSVIFLFYTNSFLIKRRKKEIGVYNILGMGKRHVAKMLTIETLITAVVSISVGLTGGVIFSRLMYLILLKLLHYDVNVKFEISPAAILHTLLLFGIIFAMTLAYNLLQIRIANPIELLRGGSQGEKEPKTKIIMTLFGVLAIGIGYYLAITAESPLSAIPKFFFAVVCVILGTYALFTAGSIALLKILRKNKGFYYKTKHFTAVSGMIYRMKQNAVGLANICILSTMVLVMISSTVSLYVGMDDVLTTRFPYEFEVTNYIMSEEGIDKTRTIIEEETQKAGVTVKDRDAYRYSGMVALQKGDRFQLDVDAIVSDALCEIYLLTAEDYNQLEDKDISLKSDEALIYTTDKGGYGKANIRAGSQKFKIAEEISDFKLERKGGSRMYKGVYLILSGMEQIESVMQEAYKDTDMSAGNKIRWANIHYTERFDLKGNEKDCLKAMKAMTRRIPAEVEASSCSSRELSRESFYTLYGGLLFIGIYLGLMFIMATVLIIYYKQISEGYDDKERYQIMQKVGMSKKEVRQSIRSQVLTVFFLPLLAAIVHIAAAFRLITKLLAALQLVNVPLFFWCTVVTVVVFAAFYAIVFAITAREYYKIVN